MEAMSGLLGLVCRLWLAVCVIRLKADLITHLNLPKPDIPSTPCVFPFTYADVTHYNCISVHSDFDWCSLDGQFQGRWRYCLSSDPPQCTFPFFFKKKVFYQCTKEDYILNRSWCSLTKNYNKDKKWKQCSPRKYL